MQHPCARCGAAVDDNSAFCPGCDAPQIRFLPKEPGNEQVRLEAPAAAYGTASPPPAAVTFSPLADRQHASYWRPAAYGSAIGVVLSFLPFGPLLGLPIAGWLAVRFYSRAERTKLPLSTGFRLGALSGLFVFSAQFVLGAIAAITLNKRGELRQALLDVANRSHNLNPNLDPQEFVRVVMTPAGAITLALMFCLVCAVLAGLGGLISAWGRRTHR